MPTNTASRATAPCMHSTSFASAASASAGRHARREPACRFDLRRRRIARGASARPPRPASRSDVRDLARPSFVDERHRCANRAPIALRSGARAVAAAGGMNRKPTTSRPALVDQRRDRIDAFGLARCFDGRQRMGGARQRVARRDADAPRAEIEREDRRLRLHRARARHPWPAVSDSREISIPSRRTAAGRRPSAGTSNTTSGSASTVSHAFCASSISSCPADQPA